MSAGYLPRLTLVLGGARSGKSRYAEEILTKAPDPWIYLATAQALDSEMEARVADHKKRRGEQWRTVEVPLDLPEAIEKHGAGAQPVLIDCLTLWLSNVLLATRDVVAESDRLVAALGEVDGPIVIVSNEVGSGIVPDNKLARAFRDAQGQLNQRVAAIADHVVLVTAGIPLTLK
ncbi:MAG: bifunctional adenosylcobinamide kinase/adenosylcobinamide-phosphate guanylyltransferase [Hyphomicrobium sp.]|nr:bifunctional adenosylcobinamide kinase/adenosylcobinamide-phosphate guanylyltransferase [Hyphomicrobium sp.]